MIRAITLEDFKTRREDIRYRSGEKPQFIWQKNKHRDTIYSIDHGGLDWSHSLTGAWTPANPDVKDLVIYEPEEIIERWINWYQGGRDGYSNYSLESANKSATKNRTHVLHLIQNLTTGEVKGEIIKP